MKNKKQKEERKYIFRLLGCNQVVDIKSVD